MAEEFPGSGWWEKPRSRCEPGTVSSSASSSSSGLTSLKGFGWLGDMSGCRPSIELVSVPSGGGPLVFLDTPRMQVQGHGSSVLGDGIGGVAMGDPNLRMMNLGLSSQTMDWDNQNLMHGEKIQTGFRAMLQENFNMNATPAEPSSRHQIQSGFQIESPLIYGAASPPSSLFQGILCSENQSSTISYQYSPSYDQNSGELLPSWSKVPQFLSISPPKHQQHNQLHFSNNAPFWNAATPASSTISSIRSTSCYFPSPQSSQFSSSSLGEKAKKSLPEPASNVPRSASATRKKSGNETSGKRSRGGTPLPPFKVRKEKMGDRITALQQLVSPFGKTDTASVLAEAIDHIKILHEKVCILSAPYMKSAGALQQHQLMTMRSMEDSDDREGPRQDLRSQGLCLVPVSSTFPVTHETTVDYWNPTFGGTFR